VSCQRPACCKLSLGPPDPDRGPLQAGDSRLFAGVHFQKANRDGAALVRAARSQRHVEERTESACPSIELAGWRQARS
jgi:hypothetical protein